MKQQHKCRIAGPRSVPTLSQVPERSPGRVGPRLLLRWAFAGAGSASLQSSVRPRSFCLRVSGNSYPFGVRGAIAPWISPASIHQMSTPE